MAGLFRRKEEQVRAREAQIRQREQDLEDLIGQLKTELNKQTTEAAIQVEPLQTADAAVQRSWQTHTEPEPKSEKDSDSQ